MKKLNIYILAFLFIGFSYSCADELTELNVDVKSPESVGAGTLLANSQVSLFNMMSSINVNTNNFRLWSQHWTGAVYTDESNYEINQRDVNGNTWNRLYATVLRDFAEAKSIIAEIPVSPNFSEANKANQMAIIGVQEVLVYQILVDTFGDVPYTEALTETLTPSYDDDEAIYSDLITKLDGYISTLSGTSGLGSSDLIYAGDVSKWKKMANSLKLRMAIRIADKNPGMAKTMAEAAVASGVMTSLEDNYQIAYLDTPPNTNPQWSDLIESGRKDFVAASPLSDPLNNMEDPRRSIYFKNLDDDGDIVGGTFGIENSYGDFSNPGIALENPTLPGVILGYGEVEFLLADASSRSFSVGGTPKSHYTAGIQASMNFWGVSPTAAATYLDRTDVDFDTASGDWKYKIGFQKWISLYNNSFETWTATRMYDEFAADVLVIAPIAESLPPYRYTYPRDEYDLNSDQVTAAAAAIGSDLPTTKVFWDVN